MLSRGSVKSDIHTLLYSEQDCTGRRVNGMELERGIRMQKRTGVETM